MTTAITDLHFRLSGCRGVLVDTNVLLDIATKDPVWCGWSTQALSEVLERTVLFINPIIYAEVSIHYSRMEDLDAAFPAAMYERESLPWEAGFLAGRMFLQYRRSGGVKTSPLPDFYIGAHAAVGQLALLTRDSRRYRDYFPAIEILAPAKR